MKILKREEALKRNSLHRNVIDRGIRKERKYFQHKMSGVKSKSALYLSLRAPLSKRFNAELMRLKAGKQVGRLVLDIRLLSR